MFISKIIIFLGKSSIVIERNVVYIVFSRKKEIALDKLALALNENVVDIEIIDLINIINKFDEYYTTSSCAGRIVILSKDNFRGKYSAKFLFKTHSPLTSIDAIHDVLKMEFSGQLHYNVEPPTFHIAAKTLEGAIKIHDLAINSSLGYSMFKTIKKSIIVELRGTGQLQMPIGLNNKILINKDHLEFVFKLGNDILSSEQERIRTFQDQISNWKN